MQSGLAFQGCSCQYSLKQESIGTSRLLHTVERSDLVVVTTASRQSIPEGSARREGLFSEIEKTSISESN